MQLRDYQREAIDSVYRYFGEHPTDVTRNPVIAMPTGTGKAVVIAGFTQEVLTQWPSQRIMMATHVKELVDQNADKLTTIWPQAPLGIFSAGLKEKTFGMPITFGNIQSIASALKKDPNAFGRIDILLVDECHMVSPSENASYQFVIKTLRLVNPRLRVIGLSATPYRLGLGMITDGGVFTDVCFDVTGLRPFNRFLDEGYLAPLVPMPTETKMDLSNVHIRGGEFVAGELDEALTEQTLWAAVQEAAALSMNRHHLLFFVPGVAKVDMVVKMLKALGISAAGVHSKMADKSERDDNIARFKAGQIRALVNADILTTGFDFPALDCIVLLRATNSPGLHVQILGRGTRPLYQTGFDLSTAQGRLASMAASYKQNCLVLDFAGNTQRLGPINDPRIPKKKGEGTGDIPIKQCNACGCLNHISARFCVNPECGEAFTFEEKITDKASTMALIVRDEPQVEVFKVDRVTYAKHIKLGSPPSIQASYYCGRRRFSEWICLEHHGNPIQRKAWAWWRERDKTGTRYLWPTLPGQPADMRDVPSSVEEAHAMLSKLATPSAIRVWVNKPKFPEIMSYIFEKEPENVE